MTVTSRWQPTVDDGRVIVRVPLAFGFLELGYDPDFRSYFVNVFDNTDGVARPVWWRGVAGQGELPTAASLLAVLSVFHDGEFEVERFAGAVDSVAELVDQHL
jgi:hypothetical protein